MQFYVNRTKGKLRGIIEKPGRRQAIWLDFSGDFRRPNAVKVSVGMVNAITGERLVRTFSDKKQDYMVAQPQGMVRRFQDWPRHAESDEPKKPITCPKCKSPYLE